MTTFTQETYPLRYWLVPGWIFSIFVGAGLAACTNWLGRFIGPFKAHGIAAAVVVGVVAYEQVTGWGFYAQRYDQLGLNYIRSVENATPPSAIVVAPWVLATPLAYAAYVTSTFGPRIVDEATAQGDRRFMATWLQHRTVFVIDYDKPDLTPLRVVLVCRLHVDQDPHKDAKLWEIVTEHAPPKVN